MLLHTVKERHADMYQMFVVCLVLLFIGSFKVQPTEKKEKKEVVHT